MHLLIHLCGFLMFPCHVFIIIRESFPRLDLIGSHTPGSGKHSCFHISLRKNEETPFLKGEEMLPHLLWSLLYKPKLQAYQQESSSRGGGQNAPQVYFPEKEGGGRIDTPPPTLMREGRVWFQSFLEEYSLQIEKSIWHLQPGLPGCLSAHGPVVAFPGNFDKNGSTRLQHCSRDPDPLSRICTLISPNFLIEDGQWGLIQKPRTMGDITETDKYLFDLNVLT